MANYKMIVAYEGAKYSGWQKQGNTENTIQERIENVLSLMLDENIEVNGAGRTDAGVHASAQTASFKCEKKAAPEEIRDYCNRYLPKDIRVIECTKADGRFHARLNAVGKHYRYRVAVSDAYNVFERRYMAILPEHYNISNMRKAAALMCGEYDFMAFCDNKHMKKSTVRKVTRIDIREENGEITMDFFGNGFLYHMVRIMAGTLLEVGKGDKQPADIGHIIASKDRNNAGFLAPASGLTLIEVYY